MTQQPDDIDFIALLDATQSAVIALKTLKSNLEGICRQCDRQINAIEQQLEIALAEAISTDTAPSILID